MRSRTRRRVARGALYLSVALGAAVGVFEAGRAWLPARPNPPQVAAAPPGLSGPAPAQRGLLPFGPVPLSHAGAARAPDPWPIHPSGAGIAVPEPSPGILWIAAIAALYTLYVPPRSW